MLGIDSSLALAIVPLGLGSVTTLDDLRSQLETAGFVAQQFMTDAELTAAPPDQPADDSGVSRVYTIPGLHATTSLTSTGLTGLADLVGVNLTGSLGVNADLYFTITFGLDSGGFYLLPGEIASAPILITGKVDASLGPLVDLSGTADVNLQANVMLSTSHADGRVRLDDLTTDFGNTASLEVNGGAALNVDAEVTVFDNTLPLTGTWLWDF